MKADAIDILLVEDNKFDRELTLNVLQEARLVNQIKVLTDGESAVNYILSESEKNPDLILLDLNLPKIGGQEILKKIRMADQTKDIPILILTSSKEENDIIESYRWGIQGYIVKPVNFIKLANAMKNIGYYWLLIRSVPHELSP